MSEKDVWNEIAPSWNKYKNKPSVTAEDFLRNTRGKVLDLGCGSGRNFVKVKGQELYATDFSEEMIDFAKSRAKKKKMDVNSGVMDAESLLFEDNFFDGVLCFAVLHCIKGEKKRKKVLQEIYRVLKPGGHALISAWGWQSARLRNKGKEDLVPWTVSSDNKVLRYNYIFDLNELEKELKDVGFKIDKLWEERNVNAIVVKSS